MSSASLSKHRLPFALHLPTGRMVSPAEAANGLKCNCICHVCRSRLMSKQGDERAWHFAHHEATSCPVTVESAIHAMAKQLIVERRGVYLPERVLQRSIRGARNVWSETISVEVQSEGFFDLEDCVAEKTVFDSKEATSYRRPDVFATLAGRPIAIEIHNTHAVEFEKAEWLDQQGLSALEIDVADLSDASSDLILQRLTERLFQASNGALWLTHAGDAQGKITLDQLESDLRLAKRAEEEDLLAQLAALEEKQRKRDEFREKTREFDSLKIRLGSGTLRIGVSSIRCTLKVHGAIPDHWFKTITAVARQHGGIFNARYRTWEFYRDGNTQPLFESLCQAAQERIFTAVRETRPATSPTPDFREAHPVAPPKRYFDDPVLQEAFDERAGIMEFDGHLEREDAERAARIAMQATFSTYGQSVVQLTEVCG